MPPPPFADTLTTSEVCARLGVSRGRLRDLECAGLLTRAGTVATPLARAVVYEVVAVDALAAHLISHAAHRVECSIAAAAEAEARREARRGVPVVPAGMLTAAQVAARLGVRLHTLKDWNRTGKLCPVGRLDVPQGGTMHRLYRIEAVERALDLGEQRAPAQRVSAVADSIRAGVPLVEALDLAGVSKTTWNYWARTRHDAGAAAELARAAVPAPRRPPPGSMRTGRPGWVYFVSGPGRADLIKIGWTQNAVEERVVALQTGSPVPLLVLASVRSMFAFERWCHRELAEYRRHGEWFARAPRLIRFIGRLRELGDITRYTPGEVRALFDSRQVDLFTGGANGPTS